ncbi:hypothetical protein A3A38_01150 [Candidatus Kaiserbacteria bacterium RIFCSPLOWO2_01_FULL_53_17]|uniref:HicB-like antitoxin of toxin-antitoxin system domain-containing protein n=1 Tax=Candidatus Kaiserbacteria bacterium RIFCSPLOWO2_01_FULL_53_17 TaxID=1798511 RepID=A0A1F6EI62_9BACT|nr:MAG: hypothetical protein A3A38_01150 [Candidatus Kaiserbacteria bacterium RIFCSPLOWO2_01_FULL_53_17]
MKKKGTRGRKTRRSVTLPVLIERDENGMYVGIVPSLRSCYTQGETLEELYENLREVVALSSEVEREHFRRKSIPHHIVGFQNIEFALT